MARQPFPLFMVAFIQVLCDLSHENTRSLVATHEWSQYRVHIALKNAWGNGSGRIERVVAEEVWSHEQV